MTSQTWFSFRAAADSLTIDITDEIGYFGVSARDFANQLKALPNAKTITLNLDCPGGDCNDGFTIYDALTSSGAEITVNITGLAASMASVIMLAGKTINIAENGRVMIHRVTGGAMGNADEMDAATKLMRQFEDRIVGLYTKRTGKPEEEIRDLMKAQMGTWFFGQEAVDAGFADAVVNTKARNFKASWAPLFTMLPAALFDSAGKDMEKPSNSESLEVVETPAEEAVTEVIETTTTSETPETPVEPATAPEVEAKGILERITAAFTGSEKLKAELAKASALVIDRDNEIAALKAEVQALKPKAEQLTEITAKLAEAEAKAKSVGLAAAEIAAAHGIKPEQLAQLPAPSETDARDIVAEFNAITDPAERGEFYRKNKAELRKKLFNR
jgi:ATP-dependent protease ClpP protease subunit